VGSDQANKVAKQLAQFCQSTCLGRCHSVSVTQSEPCVRVHCLSERRFCLKDFTVLVQGWGNLATLHSTCTIDCCCVTNEIIDNAWVPEGASDI
jgi:hypothetical protein